LFKLHLLAQVSPIKATVTDEESPKKSIKYVQSFKKFRKIYKNLRAHIKVHKSTGKCGFIKVHKSA